MDKTVRRAASLHGEIALPGDKSIAHRSALLSSLADGVSTIEQYPSSADPQSTLGCLRQLGVDVDRDGDVVTIQGRGRRGLQAPDAPIDCGNSGTLMRLIAGLLAAQPFDSTLVGDASLSARPMNRIVDPLEQMGARLELTDGHAPIHVAGGHGLQGITYRLPVASAQVKSCVLLAGLYAEGGTTVIEPVPARDHTERMLGLDVLVIDGERHLHVAPDHVIEAREWRVPRDFSAAAFFLVAGTIVPESELHLPGVGLNPTRSALIDVLRSMGADITVKNERSYGGEPIADLTVRSAELEGVSIGGSVIPNLIDEVPVLAVAATCAEGRTEIRDAAELRVKETDRVEAMVHDLEALGADVEAFEDGLAVTGGRTLCGATVDSYDDHRIAMAMGVAALVADGETTIRGAECANVSFPGYWDVLDEAADDI